MKEDRLCLRAAEDVNVPVLRNRRSEEEVFLALKLTSVCQERQGCVATTP